MDDYSIYVDIQDYDVIINAHEEQPTKGTRIWRENVRERVYEDCKLRKYPNKFWYDKAKEYYMEAYGQDDANKFRFWKMDRKAATAMAREKATILGRLKKKNTFTQYFYCIASEFDLVNNIKRQGKLKHKKTTTSSPTTIKDETNNNNSNAVHEIQEDNSQNRKRKFCLNDNLVLPLKKSINNGVEVQDHSQHRKRAKFDQDELDIRHSPYNSTNSVDAQDYFQHRKTNDNQDNFDMPVRLSPFANKDVEIQDHFHNLKRNDDQQDGYKNLLSPFRERQNYFHTDFMEETRSWIFQKFDQWIASGYENEQILTLLASAGFGKSQIANQIVHRYRNIHVIAWYFFRFDHKRRSNPKNMLLSLAHQLADRFPNYASTLNDIIDKNKLTLDKLEIEYNVTDIFFELLREPLIRMKLGESKKYVIVIDALDECDYDGDGKNELLDCLREYFLDLPKWLKIFITSRPEINVQNKLRNFTQWIIEPTQDKRNEDDLKQFFYKELHSKLLFASDRELIIDSLVKKSGGLFMVGRFLVDSLKHENCQLTRETINNLPNGNQFFYETHFTGRIFSRSDWAHSIEWKVLKLITIAFEPIPIGLIKELISCTQTSLIGAITKLTLFLTLTNEDNFYLKKVSLCHKSLKDWLTDEGRIYYHNFAFDQKSVHESVAKYCLAYFEKKSIASIVDPNMKVTKLAFIDSNSPTLQYLIRNCVSHLCHAKMQDKARKLVLCVGWIMVRAFIRFDHEMIRDYQKLEKNDTTIHLLRRAFTLASSTLQKNPYHLPTQLIGRLYGALEVYSKKHPVWIELSTLIRNLEDFSYGYQWWCPVTATWEQAHDQCLMIFKWNKKNQNKDNIRLVSISPDGTKVASCDDHQSFIIWDANTGEIIQMFEKNVGFVLAGIWCQDYMRVASYFNTTIRIWDTHRKTDDIELKGNFDSIIKFSHDQKMVATTGSDKSIKIWDLDSNGKLKHIVNTTHKDSLCTLSWSPDNTWLVSGAIDGEIYFWNIASTKSKFGGIYGKFPVIDWSSNTKNPRVVVGSNEMPGSNTIGVIDFFNCNMDKVQFTVQHPVKDNGTISCIQWSPDGKRVAFVLRDNIMIWTPGSDGFDTVLEGRPHGWINDIRWSNDGMTLVSGSIQGACQLWSLSPTINKDGNNNNKKNNNSMTSYSKIDNTKYLALKDVPFQNTISDSLWPMLKPYLESHSTALREIFGFQEIPGLPDWVWFIYDDKDNNNDNNNNNNDKEFLLVQTTREKDEICQRKFWNSMNGQCVMEHKFKISELSPLLKEEEKFSPVPNAWKTKKYDPYSSNQIKISAIHPVEIADGYRFRVNGNIGYASLIDAAFETRDKPIFFTLKK